MAWEYTEELADEICELMESGKSMRQIGEMESMPSMATMIRWLKREDLSFESKCARARRIQGELAVDKHQEILDKLESGIITPDIARVLLAGLEWRTKKLEPKKYGERINHEGKVDVPIQVIIENPHDKYNYIDLDAEHITDKTSCIGVQELPN
jgi:hypothetical protein